MSQYVDLARMTTRTTGQGTLDLFEPVVGFKSFLEAGVPEAVSVSYLIEDRYAGKAPEAREIGRGMFDATLNRFSRDTVTVSTAAANAKLDLTGDAVVSIILAAADFDTLNAVLTDYLDAIETSAINVQTGAAYILALADRGQSVFMESATAQVLTIPAEAAAAFDTGSTISVLQTGAGTTTITADAGVTLNGVVAGSGDIGLIYQGVSLIKRGADNWVATGYISTVS